MSNYIEEIATLLERLAEKLHGLPLYGICAPILCAEAGVAFLFKQWGGWIPYEHDAHSPFMHSQHGDFFDASRLPDFESGEWEMQREWHFDWASQLLARRVSKRAAGRLLDGVQHDWYPA